MALLDMAGVIFGVAGFVLAFALLISEHRGAPMLHRWAVGSIGFLCFLLACNSSVALRSFAFDLSPSPLAVGFAATLSLNWMYRLLRRRP